MTLKKSGVIYLSLLTLILIVLYLNISAETRHNRKKYALDETRNILLNIITDGETVNTLIKASKQTWIPNWPNKIHYFIGKQNKSILIESNIIHLVSNDDDYPPVNKTFDMWKYIYQNYLYSYNYFVAIDSDTYLNVNNFKYLINTINCTYCYVGQPGIGLTHERDSLDLRGPYCLGLGYIISRSTLEQFGPHIEKCRQSIVSKHSDVEMGRCIYKYVFGLSCKKSSVPFQAITYTVDKNGIRRRYEFNDRRQFKIDFPKTPPTYFFDAALVHPLKKSEYFYEFHRQVELELRPVLHPFYTKDSCVSNPIIQNETYPQKKLVGQCCLSNISLKEFIDINDATRFHTFIITLPNAVSRTTKLILNCKENGLKPEVFYSISNVTPPSHLSLTFGEWSLRLGMLRLLNDIITKAYEHVLILEDDAIFHKNFSKLFRRLFEDRQCIESAFHGVLLLGTTTWEQGWRILDKYQHIEKGLCKNICTKTFGSFAALMHRSTFQPIIDWLSKKEEVSPYDFVFSHLSRLGYPVRFAYPNLIITDVRHVSLTRPRPSNHSLYNLLHRARIHRWRLKDYAIV